jgi:hypothetical protein
LRFARSASVVSQYTTLPVAFSANDAGARNNDRPMPKKIVILSDGTGQGGGINFDEVRTNVYAKHAISIDEILLVGDDLPKTVAVALNHRMA